MARITKEEDSDQRSSTRMILLVLLAAYAIVSILYHLLTFTTTLEPSMPTVVEKKSSNMEKIPIQLESNHNNCLDFGRDNEMDQLLAKYKQVFIFMPAKAAGTTLKVFSQACMNSTGTPSFQLYDNIANKEPLRMQAFTDQLEMPTLWTSHVYQPKYVWRLIEHATRDSLLIYVHREETSRLLSSIREVVAERYCYCKTQCLTHPGVAVVTNNCTVQETALIEIIQNRQNEIGIGGPRLWTCETFQRTRDNFPNLVFMNYKQSSKLIQLVSKHHCPNVDQDFHENVGREKSTVSVVLENDGRHVGLDDWLMAKEQLLEYVLGMKCGVDAKHTADISCQGTIRKIEDKLFACPSETLQLSGNSYESHSIDFQF